MWDKLGWLAGKMMVALILIGIVFGPWVIIWAWNTLFGGAVLVAYTWQTWLAVLILGVFIRSPQPAKRTTNKKPFELWDYKW
jgi:hypothetical protein